MLSEKGSLKEVPTIKLLLSVYENKLTGILYLKQTDVLKVLYFNEGKLVWAISNSDKDKLVNILIEGSYSNELELNAFIDESDKDTFGKILVENGIITLEELIEVTKMQLKQIIISVLRWSEGSFQFTKDSPPQKFLSLELNIVEFVSEFIFKAMDISVIWKEIGSLQIELKQNPVQSKFKMYKLSENQLGLLRLFNGDIKLEGIISKYSGVQRETVLKTIYFFMISELLIKKEIAFAPLPVNNYEKEIDLPINNNKLDTDDKEHIIEKETTAEEYSFDKAKGDSDIFEIDDTSNAELSNNEDLFNGFDELDQKKKGSKVKLFLILLIIVLALSAIGFILLKDINSDIIPDTNSNLKVNEVFKNSIKPEKKVLTKKNIVDVSEEKVNINKDEIPVKMEPVKKKNIVKKKNENYNENKGKKALQYYKNGQISVAMDIWKRELKNNGIKFTILLEVACEKISVKKAFNNLKSKSNFFLLSRKIGRRNCYRVCWGKFISKNDAADALGLLPRYFFKQESPPEVIKIK